jgi:hypothetical protein
VSTEEFTPTARWRQEDDGTWTPTRTTGGGGAEGEAAPGGLQPDDILAGANIVVTDNGDGTVTIASTVTGLVPADIKAGTGITVTDNGDGTVTIATTVEGVTVYRQDFRPPNPREGDYWIRDHPGVDVTPANLLTDISKWIAVGFGYPQGVSISQGQGGISLVWQQGGPNGQQAGFVVPFVNGRVYRTEITVSPLSGAADEVRSVWGFVRDSGIITLVPAVSSTSIMDVPWNTGQGTFIMVQGTDSDLGGGVLVENVRVLDVTDDRPEQYVYDDVFGWTLLGDGGGAPDEVVIQDTDPGAPGFGIYPRLWIDPDDPGSGTAQYLPVTGGVMTGPIVLPGPPSLPSQAASKEYVDAHAIDPSAYLPLVGGALSGPLSMPYFNQTAIGPLAAGSSMDDAPGGIYFGENLLNAPHGDLQGWYIETWWGSPTYRVQRATEGYQADPATFQRVMVAGAWSPWKHLYGGLPDAVLWQPANVTVTALAWTAVPGAPNINCRYPLTATVDLSAWLSTPTGGGDVRAGFLASGATDIAATQGGGWGTVLYQMSSTVASVNFYNSHGASKRVNLNKGVTTVGITAYRSAATTAALLNYAHLLVTPVKFLDG